LKHSLETYNPSTDAITDYTQITEEHVWLTNLNGLFSYHQVPADDLKISLTNGFARNSVLGKIVNRAFALRQLTKYVIGQGYIGDFASVFNNLPSNHIELDDYKFTIDAMKTLRFTQLENNMPEVYQELNNILCLLHLLTNRDSYTVLTFPMQRATGELDVADSVGIGYNGKYFEPIYYDETIRSRDREPYLSDISDKDSGYNGIFKSKYWTVTKPLFGHLNSIPVLVYSPDKGVLIDSQ
jgi:hypothetical protein